MPEISNDFWIGLGSGGGLIFVKELFAFLLKWKKDDDDKKKDEMVTHCYQPDEQWRHYCTSRFEDLTQKINHLMNVIDILRNQIITLQVDSNASVRRRST